MSSELISTTAQQIIKINALRNTIANHIHEINRPYSTLLSVTVFLAIMMLLLLNENSLFVAFNNAHDNRQWKEFIRNKLGVVCIN